MSGGKEPERGSAVKAAPLSGSEIRVTICEFSVACFSSVSFLSYSCHSLSRLLKDLRDFTFLFLS